MPHHRRCPECSATFAAGHNRQAFCTPAHAKAYNARQLGRGQSVVSLAQAWRQGRNTKDPAAKEAARLAFAQLCRLVDSYSAEDHQSGRVPALTVYRQREALGSLG